MPVVTRPRNDDWRASLQKPLRHFLIRTAPSTRPHVFSQPNLIGWGCLLTLLNAVIHRNCQEEGGDAVAIGTRISIGGYVPCGDEAVFRLDVSTQAQLLTLLQSLQRDMGP